MVETVTPTREQFIGACLDAFSYLKDFGCEEPVEDRADPFHLIFNTRHCIVHVVGRSFGYALDVYICSHDYNKKKNPYYGLFPLWTILQIKNKELCEKRYSHTSGQLKMVRMDSEAVKTYASDLLTGDFILGETMQDLLQRHSAEMRAAWDKEIEDHNVSIACNKANIAFKKKDYRTVVNELGKYRHRLTRSQILKLDYSIKNGPKPWFKRLLGGTKNTT